MESEGLIPSMIAEDGNKPIHTKSYSIWDANDGNNCSVDNDVPVLPLVTMTMKNSIDELTIDDSTKMIKNTIFDSEQSLNQPRGQTSCKMVESNLTSNDGSAELDDSFDISQEVIGEMLESVVKNAKFKPCPTATPVLPNKLKPNITNVNTPSPRVSKRKRVPKKSLDYDNDDKKEEKVVSPPRPVKEKVVLVETAIIWKLGDLVWAYVPGHPLWPCMITLHPEEEIFTKMHGGGPKGCRVYHVQFLGDRPERGWINERRVFLYNGPDDYEIIIEELTTKSKKMSLKVPRLDIPVRLKQDWDSAVDEIQEAVPFNAEERIQQFGYDFKPYIKKLTKPNTPENHEEADVSFDQLLAKALVEDISFPGDNCLDRLQTHQDSNAITNGAVSCSAEESLISETPGDCLVTDKCIPVYHVQYPNNKFAEGSGIADHAPKLPVNPGASGTCAFVVQSNCLQNKSPKNISTSVSHKKTEKDFPSGNQSSVEIADPQNFLPNVKTKLLIHYTRSKKKTRAASHDSQINPKDALHLIRPAARILQNNRRKCTSESNIALQELCVSDNALQAVNWKQELTHQCTALSKPKQDHSDENNKTTAFHECLGLVAKKFPSYERGSIITASRAEKALSALKIQQTVDINVCTCTALEESRGLGEFTYTIQDLISAIKSVEEGFPYRHVAANFRIPATTLWDYTMGKKVLAIKHHSSCAMFLCSKYVIIDNKIHHIKLIGECRRLQLQPRPRSVDKVKSKLLPVKKASVATASSSNKQDIVQFEKGELATAWHNYRQPGKLQSYKSSCSESEDFTEQDFRLAMRKCLQGASVHVSTAAHNISLQMFCKRIKYFLNKSTNMPPPKVALPVKPSVVVAKNSYSHDDLLASLDKILTAKTTVTSCSKEYGIPNTTIRDCIKRNAGIYQSLIKSKRLPHHKRLGILKANRHLFRIMGPQFRRRKVCPLKEKVPETENQNTVDKIKQLKKKMPSVVVSIEDNISPEHKQKMRHRDKPSLFSGKSWTYTKEDLHDAVCEVRKGGRVRTVANKYGIPASTLKDNARGRLYKKSKRRIERVVHGLGMEMEANISSALKTQLDWGWNLSKENLSKLVTDYLESLNHINTVTNIWLKYFCIRNNIEYCDPQAETTPTEADPFLIYAMFDKLEKISQSLGVDNSPSQVYLVQEFLVKLKNMKNASIVSAINAAGEKFNPLVIISGGVLWSHSCQSGVGQRPKVNCAFSEHGQFDQQLFELWLTAFLDEVQEPALILLDSHLSELPISFMLAMMKKKVAIVKLPHASSCIVFEVPYNKVVKETLASVSGKTTKKYASSDIVTIAKDMWTDILTPETIISSFDESGLFPINRDKYPAETFSDEKLHDFCIRNGSSTTTLQTRSQHSTRLALQERQMSKENENKVGRKLKKLKQKHAVKRLNSARQMKNERLRQIQKEKNLLKKELKEKLLNSPKTSSSMNLSETKMFELYCQRHKPSIAAQNPEMTPEQLEAMIWMEWEALSSEERTISVESELGDLAATNKPRRRSLIQQEKSDNDEDEEPVPLSDKDQIFSCPACNISYPTKFSLGQHKRWCLPTNSGSKSKGKFGRIPQSGKTASTVTENGSAESAAFAFTCDKCLDKFFSAKALQIHRKFCTHTVSTGSKSPRQKLKSATPESRRGLSRMDLLAKRKHSKDDSGRRKSLDEDDRSSRRSSNHDDASSNGDDNGSVRRSRWKGPQLGSTTKRENICPVCEDLGDELLPCTGGCCQSFHPACISVPKSTDPFKCKNCQDGTHPCFICKKSASEGSEDLGEIKRCNIQNCGRSYHTTCLHLRKLAILGNEEADKSEKSDRNSLLNNNRCTLHHCATCASKAVDDHTACLNVGRQRMFKCVRCPTAYHAGDDCIAAGSLILPGLNIVCPDHFAPHKATPHHQPVHVSWCFVCSKGGQLMCCEGCPAAFHPTCVEMERPPDGEWFCHDCQHRLRPLYGDIVWVKLGSYRWWPGEITHPNEIPDNIQRLHHGIGEFVVKFFGSNDYFWLNKRRVFAYQEGDTGASAVNCSRGISSVFNKALQVARERFENIASHKQKLQDLKSQNKRPSYKHIKVNKPCGNVQVYTADPSEISRCICKRSDPHPCGAESECLNRMLMYECHPTLCPAGDKCENQNFQKRAYPESDVFKTNWGGWGLRTKVRVKKGEFVNEYVGELVDNEECLRRIEHAHKSNVTNFYMLTIDKDRIIDAGPKGNYSRFMNHSCDPSCETQKWTVNGDTRVGLFARKDIPEGGEFTFNYNLDCLGNDKTTCMCGAKNCSGFIGVRPKPQMGNGNNLNSHRNKRKRKKADTRILPKHDDFCFRCRQTGTLVCCDVRGCQRAFCLSCLRLTKPPFGKWECPWHHCDFCGRRAQSFCHFCPNSFCASHVKNQLVESVPSKYDCCTDHDPNVAEYEMEEAIVTVAQSMIPPETWNESVDEPTPIENIEYEAESKARSRVKREVREPEPQEGAQSKVETPKRKRGRPRKNAGALGVYANVEAVKAESEVDAGSLLDDSLQIGEEENGDSDSDEDLGPTMTSPVKRKRTKTQYYKGRKKKRRKSHKDRSDHSVPLEDIKTSHV